MHGIERLINDFLSKKTIKTTSNVFVNGIEMVKKCLKWAKKKGKIPLKLLKKTQKIRLFVILNRKTSYKNPKNDLKMTSFCMILGREQSQSL